MIVNSKLSDHFTICLNLSLGGNLKSNPAKNENHFFPFISEYNLKDGDDENWYRLGLMLNQINWDSILEELCPEESLKKFVSILEDNVALIFKKQKVFQSDSGQVFKRKNKIPRPVRILMRNKTKLSRRIMKVKSTEKYLKMKDKLE